MAFKLVESLALTLNTACKTRRNFLPKSQCSYLKKARFCSKTDKDDLPESNSESKVKELLKSASPLKSSVLEVEKNMWATSPYPEGTVFKDMDSYEEEKLPDNSTKSVIMFPGQGNQFVGMGKNLLMYPAAVDMFESASKILGYNLKTICFKGPENVLNDTRYCQPATFVCSLALLEKLKLEKPWVLSNCIATCGYSLGELTALVFAGCINFETGLRLVNFRAKAMAKCCADNEGGMLTIFTGPHTTLGAAFSDAIEHCKTKGIQDPVCATASYLFPNCKVIAGNKEALIYLRENASKYGIRKHSELPVSGAFHTDLMKEAAESFREYLKSLQFKKPLIKVFSNVTAKPYFNEKEIKKLLPKQITRPVRWEQTVQNLFSFNKVSTLPFIYECGPGSSLTAVIKKIHRPAAQNCYSLKM